MVAVRGEPLFICDWDRALFIHYEADRAVLQKSIPFRLDLYEGRAFVSIVAFTMRGMRPRFGGQLAALLCKPIATHGLLNVRTYVRHNDEPGIYFMSEWLENRMSVALGPRTFGLPYRFGRLEYKHTPESDEIRGRVSARDGSFNYRGPPAKQNISECEVDSLSEFLLERYTAFTAYRGKKRFFRVWHEPWRQVDVDIDVSSDDLLGSTGGWWKTARQCAANYSPGITVWMGWPHRIR
jgi:uncharacterized protein YqjF (DUF2071 family)